ncbi:MAG: type II toxin-antitoxin system HicB family antitoxin [Verrucomicrobia bacterium]|nr:type II toxin-antitoxin system HicB family antitoxin [Verrucomicrobiota bacterium]
MKYLLVVESGGEGYSGFFPDVPGYAAAGESLSEVVRLAEEGLAFHLEDEPEIPESHCLDHHVEAGALALDDDSLSFVYVDYEPVLATH